MSGGSPVAGSVRIGRTAALALLFLVLPLAVFPACYDAFQIPKAALLAAWAAGMSLVWAWPMAWNGKQLWTRTPADAPIAFLLCAGVLCWLTSRNGYLGAQALSVALSYVLLFFLIKESGKGPLRILLWAAVAAGAIVSLVALGEPCHLSLFQWAAETDPRRRIVSTVGSAQFVACYLAPLPAIALALAWGRRGIPRAAGLCAAGLITLATLLTATRIAYIACAASLALFAAASGPCASPRSPRRVAAVIALLLGLCVPVGLLIWGAHGIEDRLSIWRISAAMAKAHPVLGWGPGTFACKYPEARVDLASRGEVVLAGPPSPDSAHNDYLQLLVETGMAGGAAALWLIVTMAYICVRTLRSCGERDRPLAAALAGGLLCFALVAAAHFPFRIVPAGALACLLAGGMLLVAPFSSAQEVDITRVRRSVRLLGFEVVLIVVCWWLLFEATLCAGQVCRRRADDFSRPASFDLDEAEEVILQAAAIDPHNGEIRFRLGTVLYSQGQWNDACRQFERSLATHAGAYTYLMMGKCFEHTGNADAARKSLARAIAMDPSLKPLASQAPEPPK